MSRCPSRSPPIIKPIPITPQKHNILQYVGYNGTCYLYERVFDQGSINVMITQPLGVDIHITQAEYFNLIMKFMDAIPDKNVDEILITQILDVFYDKYIKNPDIVPCCNKHISHTISEFISKKLFISYPVTNVISYCVANKTYSMVSELCSYIYCLHDELNCVIVSDIMFQNKSFISKIILKSHDF